MVLQNVLLGALFVCNPMGCTVDQPVVSYSAIRRVQQVRHKLRLQPRFVARRIAVKQVGIWYRWGGATRKAGFDCSGLMFYAWGRAGVRIPRTTYDQIHVGSSIASVGRARVGDLLFPSTGHVQMYLGGGKAVEAAHRGTRVRIRSVYRSYMAIRRPQVLTR